MVPQRDLLLSKLRGSERRLSSGLWAEKASWPLAYGQPPQDSEKRGDIDATPFGPILSATML